jgi:hypothetical protein
MQSGCSVSAPGSFDHKDGFYRIIDRAFDKKWDPIIFSQSRKPWKNDVDSGIPAGLILYHDITIAACLDHNPVFQ